MSQSLPQGQMIPPNALTLSDVINGVIRAFRARFGLYLLLGALPAIVGLIGVIVLGVVVATVVAIVAGSNGGASGIGPGQVVLIIIGVLVLFVALIVFMLFTYRVQGMIALLTNDLCHGRNTDFADLWNRTRGLMGRVFSLVLLLAVVIFVIGGILLALAAWLIIVVQSGISSSDSSASTSAGAALASASGFLIILIPVLSVAAVIIATRLYVLLPVLAIEELGGFDGLRRAWQLTKGYFFRTLGYCLLLMLIFWVINWVAGIPFNAMGALVAAPLGSESSSTTAMLLFLVPMFIMAYLPVLLVSLLSTPASLAYQTIYYIDLVRRHDYGMVTPGSGAPSGQYAMPYGQAQNYPPQTYPPQNYPPQGYPPQGYPSQGYPNQGYPNQNPPQNYPPQDYPSQGYPNQNPPQNYPPQNWPPQNHPS